MKSSSSKKDRKEASSKLSSVTSAKPGLLLSTHSAGNLTSKAGNNSSINNVTNNSSNNGPLFGLRSLSPIGPGSHSLFPGNRVGTKKRSSSPTSHLLPSIWHTDYVFDPAAVKTPIKLLFADYQCLKPLEIVDLKGWRVNTELFELMRTHNKDILKELYLDHASELSVDHLEHIRGASKLRILSVHSAITVNAHFGKIMGSFASLIELDICECPVEVAGIEFMSTSCAKLRRLTTCNNHGLNDTCLLHIASWVQRFRQLSHIIFQKCDLFTDDGVLEFLAVCQPLIRTVSFEGCRKLSSLSLAGLRKPMRVLDTLNVSGMLLNQTPFEWISEGCLKLRSLNVSKSTEFDDESLMRIAKQCPLIDDLNISKCVKVSDAGIIGFFNNFEGSLNKLDMSLCILCGSKSVLAVSEHCESLYEIKLSGLSQVASEALCKLWKKASKLVRFDMIVELRVTSTHRRSLLAHVDDDALCRGSSTRLKELFLTGACLISDVGITALCQRCTGLHTLDISICNKISDGALLTIGKYSTNLTKLNISGCDIHDHGLDAICAGCSKLVELQINGCPRLTNCGLAPIACLKSLELLSCRNCEYVSSAPFHLIARSCRNLKQLDISGMDLVTVDTLDSFSKYCKGLQRVSSEHCSMSSIEFGAGPRSRLPLGEPVTRCCKLIPRPLSVCKHNAYALHTRKLTVAAIRIQRFLRVVWSKLQHNKEAAIDAINLALELKRKAIKSNKSDKHKFKPVVIRDDATPIQSHAARVLQHWCRRINGVNFAKRKVADRRLRRRCAVLIQKRFRGHSSRRRTWKHFAHLYVYYSKIGHIIHKLMVLSKARKLHKQIVAVQSIGRMFPRRFIYKLTRQAFVTFQIRMRNYCKRKAACRKSLARIVDTICLKDDSAVTIQKNWKAIMFNRLVVEFTCVCAHYYAGDIVGNNWRVTKVQALARGYIVRAKLYQDRSQPLARKRAAIAIQRIARGMTARTYVHGVRIYKRVQYLRWRIILCALPHLRLGKYAKRIQRRFRLYQFRRDRWYACFQIQRAYRRHMDRQRHLLFLADCLDRFAFSMAIHYRVFKGRRYRKERQTREHMAAWKMGVCMLMCVYVCV
jgi:hypothetical protein